MLIVDANEAWVRALFSAVPPSAARSDLAFVNPLWRYVRGGLPASLLRSWRAVDVDPSESPDRTRKTTVGHARGAGVRSRHFAVAALARAPRLSNRMLLNQINRCDVDVVVLTLPLYAPLARLLRRRGVRVVYYCFDPFAYWSWDRALIERHERMMLEEVDMTIAVSRALCEDFMAMPRRGPVHYLPNATSRAFALTLDPSRPAPPRPADLPDAPVIGVTGNTNKTYDWPMIEQLAARLRDTRAQIVFVGRANESDPLWAREIDRICTTLPNVRCLGAKAHEALPAYIRHFDVCFSPLAVTHQNDRRSPLRLYDYAAGVRPIVSTAVREAAAHGPRIAIGAGLDQIESHIRAGLVASPQTPAPQLWSDRAARLVELLA